MFAAINPCKDFVTGYWLIVLCVIALLQTGRYLPLHLSNVPISMQNWIADSEDSESPDPKHARNIGRYIERLISISLTLIFRVCLNNISRYISEIKIESLSLSLSRHPPLPLLLPLTHQYIECGLVASWSASSASSYWAALSASRTAAPSSWTPPTLTRCSPTTSLSSSTFTRTGAASPTCWLPSGTRERKR